MPCPFPEHPLGGGHTGFFHFPIGLATGHTEPALRQFAALHRLESLWINRFLKLFPKRKKNLASQFPIDKAVPIFAHHSAWHHSLSPAVYRPTALSYRNGW